MQPDTEECRLNVFLHLLQFLRLEILVLIAVRGAIGSLLVVVDLRLVFPELTTVELLGGIKEVGKLDSKVGH